MPDLSKSLWNIWNIKNNAYVYSPELIKLRLIILAVVAQECLTWSPRISNRSSIVLCGLGSRCFLVNFQATRRILGLPEGKLFREKLNARLTWCRIPMKSMEWQKQQLQLFQIPLRVLSSKPMCVWLPWQLARVWRKKYAAFFAILFTTIDRLVF